MQQPLHEFLRALRAADVRVSPAEAIDAHLAAEAAGYGDRTLFKDALCVTLAKTAEEVERFDACFETFFSREALAGRARDDDALQTLSEMAEASTLAEMLLEGDPTALGQAMEGAGQRAGVSEIRLSTQRSRLTRRMLEEMGLAELEAVMAVARRRGDAAGEELAGRLAERRAELAAEAARFVERQHELYARESGRRTREQLLAERALAAVEPEDMVLMQALVRRMAKRLAERYSRERRRARKGKLDVRRTLRRSMAYGGLPFEIQWKIQKIAKPSIVVMVDVSKSVAAVAHFLLLFLYSLNEVVDHLHAFAFSGRLVPVGDLLDEEELAPAMAGVLKRIGFQQTDYGQAFADFTDDHIDKLDRRTTVIILGDARTNYSDPRLDLMRTIEQRSRAVIWLNPEPESYWASGDSQMSRYRRFCHVAKTCHTLNQLERIVDDVLRTYLPT